MQNSLATMLVLSLVLAISGCSHAMNDSDIKQNPHPKQRYEITMTIDGAPGPFDSVTGKMGYEITNPDCVPKDPVSGGSSPPGSTPSIEFRQEGGGLYRGVLYLDLLQDDNYFGLGVCHWKMTDAFMGLKANGVTFGPNISYDDIVSNKSSTWYFLKEYYSGVSLKDYNDGGTLLSDYVAKNRDKFFSITLTAKEVVP